MPSTTAQTTYYQITAGPSKFDLMQGLFANTRSNPHYVEFTYVLPDRRTVALTVSLDSITRESGDGESWIFSGYVVGQTNMVRGMVKGYFSTKRRTGTLEFIRS